VLFGLGIALMADDTFGFPDLYYKSPVHVTYIEMNKENFIHLLMYLSIYGLLKDQMNKGKLQTINIFKEIQYYGSVCV